MQLGSRWRGLQRGGLIEACGCEVAFKRAVRIGDIFIDNFHFHSGLSFQFHREGICPRLGHI